MGYHPRHAFILNHVPDRFQNFLNAYKKIDHIFMFHGES